MLTILPLSQNCLARVLQKLSVTVYYEYKKQTQAIYGGGNKPLKFLLDFLASQLTLMEGDDHRNLDGSAPKPKHAQKPQTQTHAVAAVLTGRQQEGENHPGLLFSIAPNDGIVLVSEPNPPPAPTVTNVPDCILCCSKGHMLEECQVFLVMPFRTRRAYIGARGACYHCMRVGHHSNQCDRPAGCDQCQARHHRLLHARLSKNQNQGKKQAGLLGGPVQGQGAVAAVEGELKGAVALCSSL